MGHATTFGYSWGDLASITDPLSRTTKRFVDTGGRLVGVTDPLGNVTRNAYDALNEITSATDPAGSVTAFTYDGNGNLLTVTDANNHTTTYTYDSMDRMSTRTDPLTNVETYSYDAAGNLSKFIDRRGKAAMYTYDSLNRRTLAGFGNPAGPVYESTITYSYDAGNRLSSVVDSVAGTITPTFDGLDRLTSEVSPQGTISYTYDTAGRRTKQTVTGQSEIDYTYDNANRLTQIARGSATVSLGYDNGNRRTSLTLPNGIVMTYGYDNGSELSGITYTNGSTTLGTLTYGYDLAGRRTSMSGSYAQTGLPLPVSTTSYNADNQLTQWGTASLYYDANGNMTSDGVNALTWNARNQMASMDYGLVSFQYDAYGRRNGKTVAGVTTNYLYDGVNVAQELSGGSVTANLLSGGIDEVFTRTDSSGTANFLTDGLGSTLTVTNSSGSSLAQYAYEPFGNTTITSGSSTNSYQYTGRENDGTGLYFYRSRYYSPTLQRFVSEDPIGIAGGINLYAYVSNGPISSKDSFGMARDCFASWCGGVPRNPLPGRKDPSGAGGAPTNPDGTPNPREPNPAVTAATDVAGIVAAVSPKVGGVLGPATAIASVLNNPSLPNIGLNAVGLIPELSLPTAIIGAEADLATYVEGRILQAAPVDFVNNGEGTLIHDPTTEDRCIAFGGCN
jgi:RHS repeat-associated protein